MEGAVVVEPTRPHSHHSFFASAVCAVAGVRAAIHSERNIRIDIAVSLLVGVGAGFLGVSAQELGVIVLAMGMVATAELLNTSLEDAVDLAEPNADPLAARSKDIAAGAVLIASVSAGTVGLVIFVPKIARLVTGPAAMGETNLFVGFAFVAALALFSAWWAVNPVHPERTHSEEERP